MPIKHNVIFFISICYFLFSTYSDISEGAYKRAAEPKELVIVPDAGHVDLYDRVGLIPSDRTAAFFKNSLK